jgi:omega-6 fatty acid desaturase (delta-12 desaturase)
MSPSTGGARRQDAAPRPDWYSALAPFAQPDTRKATWQLVDTLVPYAVVWAAMAYLAPQHPWLLLVLSVPAAGLLVRVFIIFHDCCHGSFLPSPRANRLVGYFTGLFTLMPFDLWRRDHLQHHATVGDLDRRGTGDVWTLTLREYLDASRPKRLFYRIFRNPFVMFLIGPVVVFVFKNRFSPRGATARERFSVHFTNLGIVALTVAASLTIGLRAFVLVQAVVGTLAGAAGIWLFYVQHQFEDVYWSRHEAWDPWQAAMAGSSYYKLPRALQWITGSIGLHHIHHVQARVPNYALQHCQDGIPAFQTVPPLTIRRSLHSLRLRLWDERRQRMVTCANLRRARMAEHEDGEIGHRQRANVSRR